MCPAPNGSVHSVDDRRDKKLSVQTRFLVQVVDCLHIFIVKLDEL